MSEDTERLHERFARHDAAFVLGALDPRERREYEQHLHGCRTCQDEVAEIAETAALLASPRMRSALDEVFADPPRAEADATPPDTLLAGLLRADARHTRRRRTLTGAVTALAAACILALAVVLWPSGAGTSRPPAVTFVAVRPNPVHATAVLLDKPWGTSVELACRYDTGVTVSLPYELRVLDRQRHSHRAGAWTLVPGRTIAFTGGTDVRRDQISGLQIVLTDGTPILQATP